MRFSQSQIEGQLNDCFPYGMIEAIHKETGISSSLLAQWLNPNDERESPQYRLIQIQEALDKLNPELGDKHWRLLSNFRELSRPQTCEIPLTTAQLKSHRESFDVADAVMRGVPLYDQLKEVGEQIDAAEKHKQAILRAINEEKENGGASRFNPRQFGCDAVAKARARS